jgi:hypothetical protein
MVTQTRSPTRPDEPKKINGQQIKVMALDSAVLYVVSWDTGLTNVTN